MVSGWAQLVSADTMPIRSDAYSVRFHCPEYDTCRQECPDLLLGNMSMKNISDFNNQETIAKLLWNIRMIRIKLGAEC